MGKQYPLKAVSHTKKKKEVEEEENYSLQTEPTWECTFKGYCFLKGIVYPLAVKSTQVLDLAHQKERIAPV